MGPSAARLVSRYTYIYITKGKACGQNRKSTVVLTLISRRKAKVRELEDVSDLLAFDELAGSLLDDTWAALDLAGF